MIWIVRGLVNLSKLAGAGFSKIAPFLPRSFAWLYIAYRVFAPVVEFGPTITALREIGKSLFISEMVLRTAVDNAFAGTFGWFGLFELIGAAFFIFYFIKLMAKGFELLGLGSAVGVAWLLGIVMYFIVALGAVNVINIGEERIIFIPLKDGIWYFLTNIEVVVGNFDWWPWNEPVAWEQAKEIIKTNTSSSI